VKTNMTVGGSPLCDEAHNKKILRNPKGLHTKTVPILIRLGKRSVKV